MRRRGRKLAVCVFLAIGGSFAACSFPSVSFDSDAGLPPEGGAEAGGETGSSQDAASDAPPKKTDVDPEGGTKDATSVGDAAVVIDAAGCVTCDCDEDGYDRVDPSKGCNPAVGQRDCDDNIRAINPGQTDFVKDLWPAGTKHTVVGDWDCSGTTTRQYDYNAVCDALSACTGGFQGNPGCGGTAPYITCNDPVPLLGLLCSLKTSESAGVRTQGCH